MKLALGVATLLSSVSISAMAQSYSYECKLTSDYQQTMDIEVSADTMKLLDQYDGNGSGERGAVILANRGLQGGKGKMKDRLRFHVDYDRTEVMPGDINEYFISPELTTGGFQLRNGGRGGYVSFAGHGYSWESYICFAKK